MEERLLTIKKILNDEEIETQDQLLKRVENRGFHVTQSTISRDIAKLGLIKKRNSEGKFVYALPGQQTLSWLMNQMLYSIEQAQHMVVVKVKPGFANSVASEIDNFEWKELVGSIAGDDTILLITRDNAEASSLMKKIDEVSM